MLTDTAVADVRVQLRELEHVGKASAVPEPVDPRRPNELRHCEQRRPSALDEKSLALRIFWPRPNVMG